MQEIQHFYLNQKEPNKSCLLALRHIILQQDADVSETIKYGMPCFCYRKKAFCYLWTDKRTTFPYLLMVEGKHLDQVQLEAGQRLRMKTLPIDPQEDLPIDTIESILTAALNLYRNGTIKIKK
ncbi:MULTISPECIES: DUF1801 domain-containing protein [Sphingobacterium]|uniref:YdhG-like domain-containing protein n=3 Tax=Sphingobacterium TaxID=28453 RepID=A0A420GB62_9SPHI|nr:MULTISPECIES: DUF1801 domain-containing protein [Sphingobacterium]MBB1647265.1 hypothetical protein [Sphingobacterium sp. UME9]MCS4163223.1 hypothetical protein [Sphingobacterium sp. BIGb0116]QMV66850.1 DUF1801 domain-containing protein [Sphingobacterium paramultivorum]RKF42418.1 hypothetical protein BCY89_02780 [Sphingobacterium siyangense]WET67632.1 MAG: DUF1801 domain-containing protein [Sphingobacterium sp.]